MAIDLSANTQPVAFVRGTLHATAGNLDVVTLPSWCGQVTIRAAGTGNLILSHTGAQDAAVGATTKFTIPNGGSVTLKVLNPASYPLRVTGSAGGDPVEWLLEPLKV